MEKRKQEWQLSFKRTLQVVLHIPAAKHVGDFPDPSVWGKKSQETAGGWLYRIQAAKHVVGFARSTKKGSIGIRGKKSLQVIDVSQGHFPIVPQVKIFLLNHGCRREHVIN